MIDVNLNVFNKPYQTIATIHSLLKVSGKHIDKIFINFEAGSSGIEIVKSMSMLSAHKAKKLYGINTMTCWI